MEVNFLPRVAYAETKIHDGEDVQVKSHFDFIYND
jgi:hypothetical protein